MATRVDDTWWTTLTIQVLTPCSLHHVQSFESLAMDWPKKDPLPFQFRKIQPPSFDRFKKKHTHTHDCMYKCIKETMWTAIIFASGFWQGEHWSTVFLFQTSKPLLVSHTLKGFLSHRNIYCTAKPECCWGSWSVHVRAETQQYSKMLLSNAHFESPPLLYHKCHKDHLKLWTLDKCIDQRAFLGWFADIPASHASDRHLSTTESSILGCVPCPKKDLCFFSITSIISLSKGEHLQCSLMDDDGISQLLTCFTDKKQWQGACCVRTLKLQSCKSA